MYIFNPKYGVICLSVFLYSVYSDPLKVHVADSFISNVQQSVMIMFCCHNKAISYYEIIHIR